MEYPYYQRLISKEAIYNKNEQTVKTTGFTKIFTNEGKLPLEIKGNKLTNTDININIPSAQIKSGVIFAAINTLGLTKITENFVTRNHTEIMLSSFGADLEITNDGPKTIIKSRG